MKQPPPTETISTGLAAYEALLRTHAHGLLSAGDAARISEHLADACVGLPTIRRGPHTSLIDIGSGGGLPGLPLAISLPEARVVLLDSVGKKTSFLERAVAELDLAERVRVITARAEDAVADIGRETFDVAVARAVAAPAIVAEWLAPFVRIGGRVVMWTTGAAASADLTRVAAVLGLQRPTIVPTPSPLRDDGVLLVWPKVSPTPARFPRRPGDARRSPLA